MKLCRLSLLLLLLLVSSPAVCSKTTITLGVLASRSYEHTLAQWQPLADYLEQQLPNTEFHVEVLDFDALQAAVYVRKIDLIVTNPAFYLMLAHRTHLSVPLASLVAEFNGIPMQGYGGSILVKAERQDLQTLADLKGQRIIVSDPRSLGGYQAQAYELLQVGLHLPDDFTVIHSSVTQDAEIESVLNGKADAAFVGSGVYETMLQQGRIASGSLRVLNAQDLPGFPLKVSTRLYPYWLIAAMPQLDKKIAQQVTAALLLMPSDSATLQAIGMHSFSIPQDYTAVHEVAQALHLPPYDVEIAVSWQSIWRQYREQILLLTLVILLIIGLSLLMLRNMRRLVKAQQLIRQRTQQLERECGHVHALFNTLPDLVWLKDVQGVYLNCNPAFEQCYGQLEADIIGKTDFELMPIEIAQQIEVQERVALQNDEAYTQEENYTFKSNGYSGLFATTRTPMKDAEGNLIGILGIAHDITVDRQIHEHLFLNKERLRLALQGAADGLWDWNMENNAVYYSPRWKSMLGFADDELENHIHTWEMLVHPDDKAQALQRVEAYMQGKEERYEAEFRMHHKDGHWLHIRARAIRACDETGAPLVPHRLIGTHSDMTEHYQLLSTLKHNEQQIRLLLESASSGIWGLNTEGCITFMNPMGAKMLGYRVEDVIGRQVHELIQHNHKHDLLARDLDCPINATFMDGQSRIEDDDVFWRKDGSSFPVEYSTHPIYQDGVLTGAVVVAQDITERKQTELALSAQHLQLENLVQERTLELNEAKKVAEAASHAKSMFLANMSHEIRTPLNAVLGLAQLGLRQSFNPEKANNAFANILSAGNLLLSVVNDILDFSKIEAGQLQIEMIRFSLHDVIDQVINISAGRAKEKGLSFLLNEARDLPTTCSGDPLRLTQILVNLLSNAVKFTEHGWVRLTIHCSTNNLQFKVEDSGIGMTAEQQFNLFHPFVQADSSITRCYGGTGLGLSISSKLAELMHGNIQVRSELGKGSCFELNLPLIAPEQTTLQANIHFLLCGMDAHEATILQQDLWGLGAQADIVIPAQLYAFPSEPVGLILGGELLRNPNVMTHVQRLKTCGAQVLVVCEQSDATVDTLPPVIDSLLDRPLRARHIIKQYQNRPHLEGPELAVNAVPGRLSNLRILAAEDIEVNRLVLQEMLTHEGAQLVSVENGLAACEVIHTLGRNAFDVVLTDIQMPIMDGYSVARNISLSAPGLPVIGLTAHAMAGERERCLAAGMVDYITKPINIENLVTTILRHTPMNILPNTPDVDSSVPQLGTSSEISEHTLIDWSGLERQFNGKLAFITRLAGIMLRSNLDTPAKLRAAAAAGDYEQMKFIAHGLKGTAGNMHAYTLQAQAEKVELSARTQQADAPDLSEHLAAHLEQVLQEIRQRIEV